MYKLPPICCPEYFHPTLYEFQPGLCCFKIHFIFAATLIASLPEMSLLIELKYQAKQKVLKEFLFLLNSPLSLPASHFKS